VKRQTLVIVRRPIVCLLAWGLFLASCPPARAYAGNVAVIQSQSLPLYEQALSDFRAAYAQPFRTYNLGGDPREADRIVRAIRQHPPDVIVTIGLLASRVAKEHLGHTTLVFSMVIPPNASRWATSESPA
jgi:ABC-type uncharacterized transport system substrate-binding protein